MQASYQYEVHEVQASDGATEFGYKALLTYGNQEGSTQALISTSTCKGEASPEL